MTETDQDPISPPTFDWAVLADPAVAEAVENLPVAKAARRSNNSSPIRDI